MAVHFHKCENQTLADKRLKGTTRDLYDLMLAKSRVRKHDLVISIAELAQGIMRTYETTRLHLKKLIELGYVTSIPNEENKHAGKKRCIASLKSGRKESLSHE